MAYKEKILNYLATVLVQDILKNNEDLKDQEVVSFDVRSKDTLDGFMSAMFMAELKVRNKETQVCTVHPMIVKLMKGNAEFRTTTRSNIQFANEVYIYAQVMAAFRDFLSASPANIKIDDWIPHVYYGFYGKIPELSDIDESILAVENLTPKGYRMGPRCELDEPHLYLMTKLIAQYHATSYAMRLKSPEQFKKLVDKIIPLKFHTGPGEINLYKVLYTHAFERFFAYIDRTEEKRSKRFINDTNNLRKRYGDDPLGVMEYVRGYDGPFSLILHGDYNRNNVLFSYDSNDGYEKPTDIKMIDFQENRYGTPCFDLAFNWYMNMDPSLFDTLWDKLLKYYHDNLIKYMADILNCTTEDKILEPYSFNKFIQHFSEFAFYGTMVGIHFIPWMVSPEEECSELSRLFETDMQGEKFHKLSLIVGGDLADERIMSIVEHASQKGYMDFLKE